MPRGGEGSGVIVEHGGERYIITNYHVAGKAVRALCTLGNKERIEGELHEQVRQAIETALREANLREADLRGADLIDADLSGAKIQGLRLEKANLSDTQIDDSFAKLQKWKVVWQLMNLDVSGKDLSGHDLSEAYMRSVNLSGATLD